MVSRLGRLGKLTPSHVLTAAQPPETDAHAGPVRLRLTALRDAQNAQDYPTPATRSGDYRHVSISACKTRTLAG
jgi:hypothetical protein